MIEAACSACGNINRVAAGELPEGTRFVTCASCKARVALPTKTTGAAPPPPPAPSQPLPVAELVDLPAPKRASGADAPRPAPRALDLDDMLPSGIDLPAPHRPKTDDGLADLPAPKGPRPTAEAKPSEPPSDEADLPAPKAKVSTRIAPPPVPAPPPIPARPVMPALPAAKLGGLGDLPAPRPTREMPKSGLGDLPVPVRSGGVGDLPAPVDRRAGGLSDLPAPKRASGVADLPTPVERKPPNLGDLPAPKAGLGDLPAPKAGLGDLPTPRPPRPQAARPAAELPTPKPELPAPKGFFDDLPQPAEPAHAKSKPELPAPKGFFDDLPQPAQTNKIPKPELPAPKGFFDDLPGKVNPTKQGSPELPAPKGFFDDLPGRVSSTKPPQPELPAPKGFFDDLPQPARTGRVPLPTSAEPLVDLSAPVEIDPGPELDLHADAAELDQLDIAPAAPAPLPRTKAESQAPRRKGESRPPVAEVALELDEEPKKRGAKSKKLGPKRTREPSYDPLDAKLRAKRLKILAFIAVGVLALGGAGALLYKRHLDKQERAAEIEQLANDARKALAGPPPKHWDNAARAAKRVLELDDTHPLALGVAAEGLFADGLANGVNAPGKYAQAKKLVATALEKGINNPHIERAQALASITAGQPDRAITKLAGLRARAPKDGTLAVYLGWAHEANNDPAAAIKAYTEAMADEQVKVFALYGRARAKLAQADSEGARGDFTAVLELSKDHVGAQVGLAAAMPAAQAQQQESDLLAILERKDIATGDPRAVVQAYSLAAEAARRSGRLDVARERYNKALKVIPQDVGVMAGLAAVDLRDNKLEPAWETITKALTLSANDLRAQLVAAEISIRRKSLDDAEARVQALAARTPPPPPLDLARIKMVSGKLLEARGNPEGAVDAYVEAAKLAGDIDLTPSLTAVAKLGELAEAATTAKELDKAAALRARAEQLIATLADNAQRDPQLALTLGTAYLQANDAAKAETWLRRVTESRPADAEGHYQLARALAKLDRVDDAIEQLRRAVDLAPGRVEIALELARVYEASARDTAASEVYTKLLLTKDPVVDVRARAGRFYARTKQIDKAAEQGAKILEAEPTNPAGYYLKGEGVLAAGKPEEAARLFRLAVDQDRDPQYLVAQGRAAEALVVATSDNKFQDAALRAYLAAVEIAPQMFDAQLGVGRLYVARRESKKSVPPLVAAHKLRPEDATVAKLLGLAYKDLQETKVAIEWLSRSYKFSPDAETAWSLGQLLVDTNQPKLAITALENATRLATEDEKQLGPKKIAWLTEALHKLGRIQMDQGNEREAKRAWEQYVAREPPVGAQLDEVRRLLATTLQRY